MYTLLFFHTKECLNVLPSTPTLVRNVEVHSTAPNDNHQKACFALCKWNKIIPHVKHHLLYSCIYIVYRCSGQAMPRNVPQSTVQVQSFQWFIVEKSEILAQSPYGQYKSVN